MSPQTTYIERRSSGRRFCRLTMEMATHQQLPNALRTVPMGGQGTTCWQPAKMIANPCGQVDSIAIRELPPTVQTNPVNPKYC